MKNNFSLSSVLEYLSKHSTINIIILIAYYLLVVLPHEQVGLFAFKVFGKLPRSQYDLIMLVLFSSVLVFIIFAFKKKFVAHPQKKQIIFYLFSTIVFAAVCINLLFVVNIEAIHFVQYAGFAFLCFPLIKNYSFTLIYATIAGAFDEAYQYFYLSPERTDYYDLNDVIINLVGAAFGLIFIKVLQVKFTEKINWKQIFKYKLPYVLICLAVFILVLTLGNWITTSPETISKTGFYWIKKMPNSFLTKIHPNILYHIILPLEGLIITIFLWLFYSKLDKY